MKILITGTAGFIGFHLVQRLLEHGDEVVGLDNINDYYDVNLKYARLAQTGIVCEKGQPFSDKKPLPFGETKQSEKHKNYRFIRLNLEDCEQLFQLFDQHKFDAVCNLAAQAGVRYSIENPHAYIDSNIIGFINILEACRHHKIKHLVYASSSSVYGSNTKMPLSTNDNVDHPISLYAATKKSNELMAHVYSHLYGFPTTGLRFFTVYGPWGRPDMALFIFTKSILEGVPVKVFNHGQMFRDFTYIDDIIEGVVRVINNPPSHAYKDSASSSLTAPYKVYNIGRSAPVKLLDFIDEIEQNIGKEAIKEMHPIQPGDVPKTFADVSGLENDLTYHPQICTKVGVRRFIEWYRTFYRV